MFCFYVVALLTVGFRVCQIDQPVAAIGRIHIVVGENGVLCLIKLQNIGNGIVRKIEETVLYLRISRCLQVDVVLLPL